MTRQELIDRLRHIAFTQELIADIEADGVLDVQAPTDIAESMKLPRPAPAEHSVGTRYLVIPLDPNADELERSIVATCVRNMASHAHMTPLGSTWDVNQLWRAMAHYEDGMPLPADLTTPLIKESEHVGSNGYRIKDEVEVIVI